MATLPVLLKLVEVSKRFDAVQSAEHLEVLRGITLEILRGESLGNLDEL